MLDKNDPEWKEAIFGLIGMIIFLLGFLNGITIFLEKILK